MMTIDKLHKIFKNYIASPGVYTSSLLNGSFISGYRFNLSNNLNTILDTSSKLDNDFNEFLKCYPNYKPVQLIEEFAFLEELEVKTIVEGVYDHTFRYAMFTPKYSEHKVIVIASDYDIGIFSFREDNYDSYNFIPESVYVTCSNCSELWRMKDGCHCYKENGTYENDWTDNFYLDHQFRECYCMTGEHYFECPICNNGVLRFSLTNHGW